MTMSAVLTKSATAVATAVLALALSGCAESRLNIADDYGHAVHQNIVAQVADPDAHYKGIPTPGSNGQRTSAAQDRYNHNSVTKPAATSTSNVGLGGGGAPSS
jgi:hypothetical protein